MEHPAHGRLERDLMARLDGVTPGNARETAEWLLAIVGFPIEGRYHIADSNLHHLCENKAAQERIFDVIRQYVFDGELDATHGTCWKIWAQLGVEPETGYALPPDAGERLLRPEVRAELKRLFRIVSANDRVVLGLLRKATDIMNRLPEQERSRKKFERRVWNEQKNHIHHIRNRYYGNETDYSVNLLAATCSITGTKMNRAELAFYSGMANRFFAGSWATG